MTPATEDGYRPIPGGVSAHPTWHYKLTPGEAWLLDDGARDVSEIKVTEAMAEEAESTTILRWVNGKTVTVFKWGDKILAQPIPVNAGGPPPRQPRITKAARPPVPVEPPAPDEPREAPRRKHGSYEPL